MLAICGDLFTFSEFLFFSVPSRYYQVLVNVIKIPSNTLWVSWYAFIAEWSFFIDLTDTHLIHHIFIEYFWIYFDILTFFFSFPNHPINRFLHRIFSLSIKRVQLFQSSKSWKLIHVNTFSGGCLPLLSCVTSFVCVQCEHFWGTVACFCLHLLPFYYLYCHHLHAVSTFATEAFHPSTSSSGHHHHHYYTMLISSVWNSWIPTHTEFWFICFGNISSLLWRSDVARVFIVYIASFLSNNSDEIFITNLVKYVWLVAFTWSNKIQIVLAKYSQSCCVRNHICLEEQMGNFPINQGIFIFNRMQLS